MLAIFDAPSDLVDIVESAEAPYLREFMRQVRGSVSGNAVALVKRCKKWINAPKDEQKYIFMSKTKLRQIFTAKHGRPHIDSWSVTQLIQNILSNQQPQEAISFEQDLIDSIVGNCCLTRLSDGAADSCAIGHEMEPIYSKQLMELSKVGKFPYCKEVEEINTIGTVQKTGKKYIKSSVDRIIGTVTEDGNESSSEPTRKLLLVEMKARVKPETEQKERDRIVQLVRKRLMPEDGIFVDETDADHQHSHLVIPKVDERLQVLHHAKTFGMDSCIHAVGNTKNLLSVCKMNFPAPLLAAYERTLDFIYESGLNIFYKEDGQDDIVADEEEMKRIERAVVRHEKTFVDMYRFKFNYLLWRDLTDDVNLPMAPLKQLLPDALSWWNISKCVGDDITRMLWEMMYHTPVTNPQAVLVKRLAHQLPVYMCHRLFQLFGVSRNLDSFSSIHQYRDHARRNQTLFSSTLQIDSILRSMANAYNPEQPLAMAPQPSLNLAVAGTYTMHGAFPPTGMSPKKNHRAWYSNPVNVHRFEFQRRHSCVGSAVRISCDASGNPHRGVTCVECGRDGATWWCAQCRVFLHGLPPTSRSLEEGEAPLLMAAASHSRKRNAAGQHVAHYGRMSCSDRWHYSAQQRLFSAINPNSIFCMSVATFDRSQHNVNSNLSFDDATVNASEDDEVTTEDSSSNSNSNSNNNNNNNNNNNISDNNSASNGSTESW